jgi:shikimate dehydrogenase
VTSRIALIGQPLRRRHSEVMHNAAFAAHGLDAIYELREIGASDLPAFFEEARGPDWLGFQVTAPHKQAVMEYLDEVEDAALAIGAVNSGQRRADGSLVGFNTDATGFASALAALGASARDTQAVVVGAGGAARAVVWALLDEGAGSVVVANRSLERAHQLAEDLSSHGTIVPMSLNDPALRQSLASATIAVNATTMGMTTDTVAFDVSPLPDNALVFDLVYVPPDTPLVRAAEERNLSVCNGTEMLVRQAEVAFEHWTGLADTADIMRHALTTWLPHSEAER